MYSLSPETIRATAGCRKKRLGYSAELRAAIIAARANGERVRDVAAPFGVSYGFVSRLARGVKSR